MRLKSTRLVNVCQHKDLTFTDLSLGITAVTGPNGSGKSNFLTAAGYLNLTGDYSRCPNGKAGLLRRDKTPPKQAYCESVWEHNGQSFTIRRNFAGTKDTAVLTVGDKTYSKTNEVQDQLRLLLGVTQTVFDHIFVPQWGIFRCLVGTESERAKDFAVLCGTDNCETIWDVLGEQLAMDEQQLASLRLNKETLTMAKAAALADREQYQNLKRDFKHKLEQLPSKKQLEAAQTRVTRYEQWELMAGQGDRLRKQVAKGLTLVADHTIAHAAASAKSTKLLAELAEANRLRDQEQAAARTFETWQREDDRLRNEVQRLVAPTPPIMNVDVTELEKLKEELLSWQVIQQQNQRSLGTLDSSGICPTCRQDVSNCQDLLKDLATEEKLAAGNIKKLKQQISQIESFAQAIRAHEQEQAMYDRQLAALRQRRKEHAARQPVSGPNGQLQQLTEAALQAARASAAAAQEERCAERDLAVARAELASARKALAEYEEQAKHTVTKAAYDAAKLKLTTGTQMREQLLSLRGELRAVSPRVTASLQQYKMLAQRYKQQRPLQDWVDGLRASRELVHRNNLPKLVHEYYMRQLATKTNELLQDIDDPFQLEVKDGVNLQVRKHDGDIETIGALSGGEKALLAIAYRLAEMSIFAGELGMLVLDEPTAGMDASRLEKFANTLRKLGRVLKARGTQLLLVTHEPRIASCCDAVIELRS